MWLVTLPIVAAVVMSAGVSKVAVPAGLATLVNGLFVSFSKATAIWLARLLGGVEIFVGGLLLSPSNQLTKIAGGGLMLLSAGITATVLQARRCSVVLPCGCYGAASTKPLGLRNIAYAIIGFSTGLIILAGRVEIVDRDSFRQIIAPVCSLTMVVISILLYQQQIVAVARSVRTQPRARGFNRVAGEG